MISVNSLNGGIEFVEDDPGGGSWWCSPYFKVYSNNPCLVGVGLTSSPSGS